MFADINPEVSACAVQKDKQHVIDMIVDFQLFAFQLAGEPKSGHMLSTGAYYVRHVITYIHIYIYLLYIYI